MNYKYNWIKKDKKQIRKKEKKITICFFGTQILFCFGFIG